MLSGKQKQIPLYDFLKEFLTDAYKKNKIKITMKYARKNKQYTKNNTNYYKRSIFSTEGKNVQDEMNSKFGLHYQYSIV